MAYVEALASSNARKSSPLSSYSFARRFVVCWVQTARLKCSRGGTPNFKRCFSHHCHQFWYQALAVLSEAGQQLIRKALRLQKQNTLHERFNL